jgi:hypothetical protein
MASRFIGFATCALFGFAASVFGQSASPQPERDVPTDQSAWTFVVIGLRYADAEEVALTLRDLLPATVRVVPYYPTNSVLIAGDRAVLAEIEKRGVTPACTADCEESLRP